MKFWGGDGTGDDHEFVGPKGFDDYDHRLGDMLRGERATKGKCLMDVQRELKIRATHINAIENCDPSAFEVASFVPGYVRAYARYLDLDEDEVFAAFCRESGYAPVHGLSERAGRTKSSAPVSKPAAASDDLFASGRLAYMPKSESVFSGIEPGAVGSVVVLLTLVFGIAYGGWSVLQEVQRVNLSPVEQRPVVLTDLDPVDGASIAPAAPRMPTADMAAGVFAPPAADTLDRVQRPEPLDVPVLIARDGPISTLNPADLGAFADASRSSVPQVDQTAPPVDPITLEAVSLALSSIQAASAEARMPEPSTAVAAVSVPEAPAPKVVEDAAPEVHLVAAREAWVRVRAADGSTIFEGVLQPGDTWKVPAQETPPTLRVGASASLYFAVNGETYGPAGSGSVVDNVALSTGTLTQQYARADITRDSDLARVVAELDIVQRSPEPR